MDTAGVEVEVLDDEVAGVGVGEGEEVGFCGSEEVDVGEGGGAENSSVNCFITDQTVLYQCDVTERVVGHFGSTS